MPIRLPSAQRFGRSVIVRHCNDTTAPFLVSREYQWQVPVGRWPFLIFVEPEKWLNLESKVARAIRTGLGYGG